MRLPRGAIVLGAILALIAPVSGTRAAEAVPGYTFHLEVAMAMRHFPWLHFHLQGEGQYQPGESYVVHFTSVPWFFPKQQHDVDLSMLDPGMWPKRYVSELIGRQPDGQSVFALRPIGDSALKNATVTVGVHDRARKLDAFYDDGTHIQMNVNCTPVDGFFLPASLTADINEPHMALSANADFTDYAFDG